WNNGVGRAVPLGTRLTGGVRAAPVRPAATGGAPRHVGLGMTVGSSQITRDTVGIRALREARDRLCVAAATAVEADVERALDALVAAAWEAGFLRATVYSVAAVVLESELPRRGSRARRRALVERWVRR